VKENARNLKPFLVLEAAAAAAVAVLCS